MPRDPLLEADQAERSGALVDAAAAIRAHLDAHPDDGEARMRLARVLMQLGERAAVRQVLRPLDVDARRQENPGRQANRLLAELDELEGALTSAQVRWERVLADDIDDAQAHGRLSALRPDDTHRSSELSLATLVSPAGVTTSRFRLVRELGRGSSAAVYLVTDERLAIPLALKVLHPQLAAAARAAVRARFFAEARVAARLRHPGVVAVYDVDETTRSLVMEYVPGGTLRSFMRRERGSPSERRGSSAKEPAGMVAPADVTLDLARSLLDAIGYVHRAGVVHGDLKPGNVLLRSPREAVLADFGTAQLAAVVDDDSRPAGTPLYLSPEQLRGAPASAASDLYAMGAILYELVGGQPLRRAADLLRPVPTPAAPLAEAALGRFGALGSRLGAVVDMLVSFDPERRPASADVALAML